MAAPEQSRLDLAKRMVDLERDVDPNNRRGVADLAMQSYRELLCVLNGRLALRPEIEVAKTARIAEETRLAGEKGKGVATGEGTQQGMIATSALMIWKSLMCITGSDSPVVVVLSGSMEPGFRRGDILFLHMGKAPIAAGEIVVFNVDGRDIPIVHRVVKVHRSRETGEDEILTKGDNNFGDDLPLYADGQLWLNRRHVMGRAVGYLPHVGWVTIIMTEKPFIKYLLIGALGLLVITSKD